MNNEFEKQLKQLDSEDLIWFVSFFLVVLSIISNQFERQAILTNAPNLNENSREIKIVIFIIVIAINLFFVNVILEEIKENKNNSIALQPRLIAALLFLIGSIIYLIIELQTKTETNNVPI